MAALPEAVSAGFDNHEGPAVFTTADGNGTPNSVYVSCIRKLADDKFVVADNFFNKTRENIRQGSKAAVLFITKDGKSFQVKGSLDYHSSGEVYDGMKEWLSAKLPGVAAVVVNVEEAYSGAERLV
jgi:predicted pyridoxine 5'-phosphate oxidase superfamily flavin-nucleotide-binding protein